MTDDNPHNLPPFWRDEDGNDRTSMFNFYRFCQLAERSANTRLGEGASPKPDPIRLLPYAGMGFPAGELRATETDAEHPERPPVVRVNFMGLYGVESPLPTALTDDITRGREGHEAMMAFLDIFNHRILTQYYRIWRKYHYPQAFEPGGTDAVSQSLMALTGITRSENPPASRLLALLPTLLHPTHTADGLAAVIEAQAERTRVEVKPHYPVMMPVEERARLSMDNRRTLGEHLILGDEVRDANYCAAVEMYTDDPDEARGWMPDGQLRKDVMALLKVYLGCDYDVRLWVTIPTRLLPRPRLGDRRLFAGYNVMLGLDEGPVADDLPKTVRIRVGRLRDQAFERKQQQQPVVSDEAESDEGFFVL